MSDKSEIIRSWIQKGDHDLGTAMIISLHIPQYRDMVAFHSQQATEKYLKGYMIFLDIPVRRTHDLTFLLSLIAQKDTISDDMYDEAAKLEDFAVEVRYPDSSIELSDEDCDNAIQIAKKFRKFVLSKTNIQIEDDTIIDKND